MIRNRFVCLAAVSLGLVLSPVGCSRKSESLSTTPATERAGQPAAPKQGEGGSPCLPAATPGGTTSVSSATALAPAAERRLPRLVDIGAGTCIPCKMMKPILEELMATRAHQFETVFVDLNYERQKGLSYGIRVIPTQVFFDENGHELFRHEGFMSKEQILQAWEQLGYKFAMSQ
jgi:thiol-disulfide isomerase/thioredoxin